MRRVFADSGYWIALLDRRDKNHHAAEEVSLELDNIEIITSEYVLLEVLNFFSDSGPTLRPAASGLAFDATQRLEVLVVGSTSVLFSEAARMYAKYSDKGWSLVDCSSFLIMDEAGISEALAFDHHFAQRGYRLLPKQPSAR